MFSFRSKSDQSLSVAENVKIFIGQRLGVLCNKKNTFFIWEMTRNKYCVTRKRFLK